MKIRTMNRINLLLIIAIGLYGFITEEPYWRDNGHDPWLYDYFFWFALILNGPSGFAADYFSWFTSRNAELRFIAQYTFWCLFLWLQWRFYHFIVFKAINRTRRSILLYTSSVCVVLMGSFGAYEAWLYGHRPGDFCIDRYFWFVRMAGIASSGLVLLGYYFLAKRAMFSSEIADQGAGKL